VENSFKYEVVPKWWYRLSRFYAATEHRSESRLAFRSRTSIEQVAELTTPGKKEKYF
jgi:hypothetical protein